MKKMSILFLVSAFVCTTAFAEYDCQVSSNGIGDWSLVTIGGFTFAKPITIDLYPTNAPLRDTAYPIRCQVIYKDNQIARPMSDDELETIRRTGETLNSWLVEFIVADYIGVDYEDLRRSYYSGKFAEEINSLFPEHVAGKIAAMDPVKRFDLDTVTVTIEARGAFRKALEADLANDSAEKKP